VAFFPAVVGGYAGKIDYGTGGVNGMGGMDELGTYNKLITCSQFISR
jgi:hypothetical protein